MHPDGLCRLDDTTWSRCLEFEDVNYQLAKPDDQTAIFEALCDMYNAHDASIGMELSLVCRRVNKADFRKRIEIAAQEDKFDVVRALYTDMLRGQLEHGNNGMVKTKFLVLTIEAKNSKEAKARFSRIMLDALNYFKTMGALAKVLDGKEWLAAARYPSPRRRSVSLCVGVAGALRPVGQGFHCAVLFSVWRSTAVSDGQQSRRGQLFANHSPGTQ